MLRRYLQVAGTNHTGLLNTAPCLKFIQLKHIRPEGRTAAMKRSRPSMDPDVRTSKAMSKVLRHHPPPGAMDAQGWVDLPVLIQHLKGDVTEEQIRRIVENNDKKRFVLDDSTNPPRIRAAQGHSVELDDPVLEEITDAARIPCAVHTTGKDGWKAIQESGELRRMKRTHIHFATAAHHMRKGSLAQVLLQLDLQAALADGFKFHLSTNQVLLCEGPLPVKYISQVDRMALPEDWRAAAA